MIKLPDSKDSLRSYIKEGWAVFLPTGEVNSFVSADMSESDFFDYVVATCTSKGVFGSSNFSMPFVGHHDG